MTGPARKAGAGRTRLAGAAAVAALLTPALGACGSGPTPDAGADARGATSASQALHGTVTVLAAASLTESFDQLKQDFEAAHPGVTVEVSYGSSATLVQQVDNGAPASVLALAGTAAAGPLDKRLVKGSQVFATNSLEIAVPPDNPGGVRSLEDLAGPTVTVVLCADTVPCGKAAKATFEKARVEPNIVSKEVDVKATLAKVKLAEADAAVVYRSDVVAAGNAVEGVEIDARYNTSLKYPVITITDDPATKAFVAYVLSRQGLTTVQSFGFGAP